MREFQPSCLRGSINRYHFVHAGHQVSHLLLFVKINLSTLKSVFVSLYICCH